MGGAENLTMTVPAGERSGRTVNGYAVPYVHQTEC
jgi:hypothetical protein